MEIDITDFFNQCAPMDYSASRAELGDSAGADTWRAACDDAPDYNMLDTDEKRQAFRDHIDGYGAWSDNEITAFSDLELNALLMQFIAGYIREADLDGTATDWEAYESDDNLAHNIGLGYDGRVYYYLGA